MVLIPCRENHAVWSSVASVLSLAPATLSNVMFSDLSFTLSTDDTEGVSYLDSLDWESLRRSLARFSELKIVRFTIGFYENEAERIGGSRDLFERVMKEVIEQQLEDLHLQGKLQAELKLR